MAVCKTVVIVDDYSYIIGGADKVALSSAVGLARHGFRVILFVGKGNGEEYLFEREGIEVICLNRQDILRDPCRLRAITQGIYSIQTQKEFEHTLHPLSRETTIIHFHGWTKTLSASLFAVTAKYGFRFVLTVHDYFPICPNGTLFNFKKRQTCKLKPMSIGCLCSNCDCRKYVHKLWRVTRQFVQNKTLWKNKPVYFISISRLNRWLIEKYLYKRNIILCDIGNPVELNEGVPVRVQENDTYFFVGRLSAEKGVDLFCEAITSLGLKGVVLGDGYLLPELKCRYPNINFLGHIKGDKMGYFLHNCRALIFPSLLYECAPLTVTEVMSYGIPCVVPDSCAAVENVKDGETGFIFKSGNLESLKDIIMKIQKMDISNLSDNIVGNFDYDKYSMNTHIDKLKEFYNNILS